MKGRGKMKKRRFKRLLSGILAMLMMVTALPVTSFAAVADDVPEDMRSNMFLDALAYTGYDLQAQINDGMVNDKSQQPKTYENEFIQMDSSPTPFR